MNFKTLNSLTDYLNSIDFINNGGCGTSAFFIYKYFKQFESELAKPKIKYFYGDTYGSWEKNCEALNGNGKPAAAKHVMVEFDGYFYDSEGKHKNPDYEMYFDRKLDHEVTEDFLIKSIWNRRAWNNMFDFNQELPKMEKKIGINLPTL